MGGISMTISARPVLVTSKEKSEFEGKVYYKLTFVDLEDRKQYNASCKEDIFEAIPDMQTCNLSMQLTSNKFGMKLSIIGIEE